MLGLGDIAAARMLYERAAALGSAHAATAAGRTYDPAFLASIRANGVTPNSALAASWYRRGVVLGDARAADLLASLDRSLAPK
jgi:TPR repeat protein